MNAERRFEPEKLGLGLCEGYDQMGHALSKPYLRAELESQLKA
jgi:DNA topoisomerase IA